MSDDAPETVLINVIVVLEEHNRIFQQYGQTLEQLVRETAQIKQRLDKLESPDSLNPDDAKFVKDMNVRLKSISATIKEKL